MATRIRGMIKNFGESIKCDSTPNGLGRWEPDYINYESKEVRKSVEEHIKFLKATGKFKGFCKDVK